MPDLRSVLAFAAPSLNQLVFLALVLWLGGPYAPAVRLPRPKLLHLEIVVVFVLVFLANAWRESVMARGRPEPDLTIAMNALLATTLALPPLLQLLRRRPLSELGIAPIANWRSTPLLSVWIGIYVLGALLYRPSAGLPMTVHLERVAPIAVGLLGEELAFRGFIQTRLELGYGLPAAWIVSSVFFGLVHVANAFASGPAGLLAPLPTFALGLLWGATFAKTRSLFVVWPAHAAYDLIGGGLLFGR